tara:strand:+ start:215 stop:445 length:231 start_codon:yes stop_codon:yes gene_type:complete
VEVVVVVITNLMEPKMEDQVQIRAVDPVVEVAVANLVATQDKVVLVVLMDIMVVLDHPLVVLNAVVVAVEPILLVY